MDALAARSSIGGRIRACRRRRSLTQAELADLVGVTRSSLSQWENGKRDLSVWVLIRIAEELDVTLEDLIDPR